MLKVLIIEDEIPAQKKLESYLSKIESPIQVVNKISTVTELISFLERPEPTDLIFSDIELRDGNVFEAYQKYPTEVPIIFATAYDTFWMQAFETSGIAYLLKPYTFERFEQAFGKYLQLQRTLSAQQKDLFNQLTTLLKGHTQTARQFKEFVSVKSGNSIYFLQIAEILFIRADQGVLYAFDCSGKKHLLNQTSLKQLEEEMLNPDHFFKINRSEIVHKRYIEELSRYTKNSLSIKISQYHLITSERSTAAFNKWLGL